MSSNLALKRLFLFGGSIAVQTIEKCTAFSHKINVYYKYSISFQLLRWKFSNCNT